MVNGNIKTNQRVGERVHAMPKKESYPSQADYGPFAWITYLELFTCLHPC